MFNCNPLLRKKYVIKLQLAIKMLVIIKELHPNIFFLVKRINVKYNINSVAFNVFLWFFFVKINPFQAMQRHMFILNLYMTSGYAVNKKQTLKRSQSRTSVKKLWTAYILTDSFTTTSSWPECGLGLRVWIHFSFTAVRLCCLWSTYLWFVLVVVH